MTVTAAGLTLYGARGSGSAAIEAALVLAGLPFRAVEAAPWEASAALDELRGINPLAQVPTLHLADGSVLTESAAILIHLGLEYPASGLMPAEASARVQVLRGLAYIAANCYAAIGVIDYPERWTAAADAPALEAVRAGARQRLHAVWSAFADIFPLGVQADALRPDALAVLAAVVSRWSGARAHLEAARPAFFERLQAVDAYPPLAPVWSRHWPTRHAGAAAASAA